LLAAAAIGVAILAATQIGPPASSARTAREVVSAQSGLVQSTVTGTGNVQAGSDVDVNFQTSGTLADVFVSVGQHVSKDQLLATLNPTSAQLSVDQANASLTAAEDQLTAAESGGSGSSGTGGSGPSTTSLSTSTSTAQFVAYAKTAATKRPGPTKKRTKPKSSKPASNSGGGGSSTKRAAASSSSGTPGATTKTSRPTTTSTTSASTPSPSAIASAQAAVISAQANLQNAEQALSKTKLYAPTSGTIVSLASITPGDTVSDGTTGASSSASSSSGTTSGSSSGSSTAGSLGASSSGSSSGSSSASGGSSSAFAEIIDSSSMTMNVSFSESDISKIKVGQPATVTMEALTGVELAAHVSAISPVGTSSSGVVSYTATLTLDQRDSRVKPGMSASAAVIVGQAHGVTVPNQAVNGTGSLGTVQLMQNGKPVSRPVLVGLRGDSRTQIIRGVSSGQQLVITVSLPSVSPNSGAGTTSGTTGRFGGAGAGRFGGFGGASGFPGRGGFSGGGVAQGVAP
jgi:multidrug efflux pump subunit AcrA (membrane-fusion protein)